MRFFVVAIFRLKISFQQRAEQYVPALHLLDQLKLDIDKIVFGNDTTSTIKEVWDNAIALEKETIRDAFNAGMNNSVDYFIPFLNDGDESEVYYNKTFKSE